MTNLRRDTFIVTALSLGSSLLGFAREAYIAYSYGATRISDAYYVAALVPDTLAGLISVGMATAIVPSLQEEIKFHDGSVGKLMNAVTWVSLAGLLFLSAVSFVFSDRIVTYLAPGFDHQSISQASQMLKIMSFSIVFTGISGVVTGYHNANGEFFYPALVGLSFNLTLIFGTVALKPIENFDALAFGFLLGSAGRLGVQLIPFKKRPILRGRRLQFTFWHSKMRKIMSLMLPVVLSTGVTSLNLIVDRFLASKLSAGDVSILNFVSRLGLLPVLVLAIPVATTVFPRFVNMNLRNDRVGLATQLVNGSQLLLFCGALVFSVFVMDGQQILFILFRHGAFTYSNANLAVKPLVIYGCFSVFYLLPQLLMKFLYAKEQNNLAMFGAITSVVANIGLSMIFVRFMGINGLVLSNALSQLFFVLILGFTIFKITGINLVTSVSWGETLLPSIGVIIAVGFVWLFTRHILNRGFVVDSLSIIGSFLAGGGFLILYSFWRRNSLIGRLTLACLHMILVIRPASRVAAGKGRGTS